MRQRLCSGSWLDTAGGLASLSIVPPAGTEELAKKIPGARFELIEEAGHFLPTTGPKTLVRLLLDFFKA